MTRAEATALARENPTAIVAWVAYRDGFGGDGAVTIEGGHTERKTYRVLVRHVTDGFPCMVAFDELTPLNAATRNLLEALS